MSPMNIAGVRTITYRPRVNSLTSPRTPRFFLREKNTPGEVATENRDAAPVIMRASRTMPRHAADTIRVSHDAAILPPRLRQRAA